MFFILWFRFSGKTSTPHSTPAPIIDHLWVSRLFSLLLFVYFRHKLVHWKSIHRKCKEIRLYRQDQRWSTAGVRVESQFSTFHHSRSKFSRLSIFQTTRIKSSRSRYFYFWLEQERAALIFNHSVFEKLMCICNLHSTRFK